MARVIGAVQVRMSSSRLPGKVMADILGKPMLWHIIQRVRACPDLDEVVIATSYEPADKPVREFAEESGIPLFAGSETDLISRLLQTMQAFRADALVRVTGDSALADPCVLADLVEAYRADESLEYVCNVLPPTYPYGLDSELYSRTIMEKLDGELKDSYWREWFPLHVRDHRDRYKVKNISLAQKITDQRWTVDYPEDLEFVRQVYKQLYPVKPVFVMADILKLLGQSPNLRDLNAKYIKH